MVAETWAVVTVPTFLVLGDGVARWVGGAHLLIGYAGWAFCSPVAPSSPARLVSLGPPCGGVPVLPSEGRDAAVPQPGLGASALPCRTRASRPALGLQTGTSLTGSARLGPMSNVETKPVETECEHTPAPQAGGRPVVEVLTAREVRSAARGP